MEEKNCKKMLNFDLRKEIPNFTQIIGEGGFGLIKKHKNEDIVVKLIKRETDCEKASVEFEKQKKAYEAINSLKNSNLVPILVPKPISYVDENIISDGELYSCVFSMELVKGIKGIKETREKMIHLTLSEDITKSKLYPVKYQENIEKNNYEFETTRGYFLSIYDLESFLEQLRKVGYQNAYSKTIVRSMGKAVAIIFYLGNLDMKDVELVLAEDPCSQNSISLWIMDFGLAQYNSSNSEKSINNFFDNIEEDIYIPHPTIKYLSYWLNYFFGYLDTLLSLNITNKEFFFEKSLERATEDFFWNLMVDFQYQNNIFLNLIKEIILKTKNKNKNKNSYYLSQIEKIKKILRNKENLLEEEILKQLLLAAEEFNKFLKDILII